MEAEMELQQLRELVAQLKADNERLSRARDASQAGPSRADTASITSGDNPSGTDASTTVTERLLVIPGDRRWSMFNGQTGIGLVKWTEELEACMRARHLSVRDQAFFIFDHLEKGGSRGDQVSPLGGKRGPSPGFGYLD